jgi:hypothetical protein
MNKKFPEQFQKVVDWIKKEKDVDVILARGTHYNNYTKRILIHHNYNLEKNGLYSLLHEVGHALQPQTYTGANLYKSIDDLEKPLHFAMYQFINEQDAWNKAAQVADLLNLKVNVRAFNKMKEECLLSYFKHKY